MKEELKKKEELNDFININKEKVIKAFESNLKLHIKLKNSSWRNGFVKSIEADFFIFEDNMNGEEPFFWIELLKVDPCLELNKEVRENGNVRI